MHLLIPFAAPLSAAGREAMAARSWARLSELLARCVCVERDDGDAAGGEFSFSPPHERAWARAAGWQGADGCLPFAARAAQADGIAVGDTAWGLVTPAHWRVGAEQVGLADPASVPLDEADSRALFAAVRELFTSAGHALEWGAPQRWYASHVSYAGLPTASLDRVAGRNVDHWLVGPGREALKRGGLGVDAATTAALRGVRRLQSEVQMLLHEHPVNRAREARGLLPVNSFWLSGCGAAQAGAVAAAQNECVVDSSLVAPALAEDWPSWARAWDALEAGPLAHWQAQAAALAAVQPRRSATSASQRSTPGGTAAQAEPAALLTLSGERGWAQFAPAPTGLRARVRSWFNTTDARAVLESL